MINHIVNQQFEVVEKVGESPLFVVYKARDRQHNRVVAMKFVPPERITDQELIQGLNIGLASTVNLNHPNIAGLLEQGQEGDAPYFVTEFVRGINLKERIRRIAPFTLSVAIDFACAIGEALHYAHSIGQVHGDLRSHNVIISPEGVLKVTDFGVQRGVAKSPTMQLEMLSRSAHYHAPELSTTSPGTVAGDIYALGAILYEMLTGTPLYIADSPEAIADQHAFSAIPSPRVINPGVPRSVEGIVLKCLQKRPDNRYRTAADLLNDLKQVRDALRFGKPLSWSPIDIEKLQGQSAAPVAAVEKAKAALSETTPPASRGRRPEPVAEVAASSEVLAMPPANRLRQADERVSIYIRASIVAVTVVILICLIGLAGIWSSLWVVPKAAPVPQLEGKTIEEARAFAEEKKIRLIEHPEYTEKKRNIIYKTDRDLGAQVRPGQIINVWYSKGPEYVQVPDVKNLTREEAEQKLNEAGLLVGEITPENSDSVKPNAVIRQTVSSKKRVLHDTRVGLVISDGPKVEYAPPEPQPSENTDNTTNADPNGSGTPEGTTDGTSAPQETTDNEPRQFRRTISIPKDGRGERLVRIEYRDSQGSHAPVIEETHTEGDKIKVEFEYYGKEITLSIYYDDQPVMERTFDPLATRDRRVR